MTTPIKAIETRYKGYLFRSRLEARWAVFFDALGIKWEYEPEGVVLPDGTRYLPDFVAPTLQLEERVEFSLRSSVKRATSRSPSPSPWHWPQTMMFSS